MFSAHMWSRNGRIGTSGYDDPGAEADTKSCSTKWFMAFVRCEG